MNEENKQEIIDMFDVFLDEYDFNKKMEKHISHFKENCKNGLNSKIITEAISEISYATHLILYHLCCLCKEGLIKQELVNKLKENLADPYTKIFRIYISLYIKTNPFFLYDKTKPYEIEKDIGYLLDKLSNKLLKRVKQFTDSCTK